MSEKIKNDAMSGHQLPRVSDAAAPKTKSTWPISALKIPETPDLAKAPHALQRAGKRMLLFESAHIVKAGSLQCGQRSILWPTALCLRISVL